MRLREVIVGFVPPNPSTPPQLKLGPFTLADARAAGVSAKSLRGKSWRRIGRGLYCWAELAVDPWQLLGMWQRAYPETMFAGRTAAWLYGIDVSPTDPIEVIAPLRSSARTRSGLIVRRSDVAAADFVRARGLRVTSILRTLANLCPRMAGVDALTLVDAALRLRLTDKLALGAVRSPCLRGMAAIAEPAESPMETRLRRVLLNAGLPRPEVQTNLHDATGRFVGRADLYYPHARLVIEVRWCNHRDRLVEDNRSQNALVNAGCRMLRFTASDIYNRRETIVAQVSAGVEVSAKRRAGARR